MNNIIKNRPALGDIVVIVNGERKFVAGNKCTKDFIDSLECLGVVYDVQSNFYRVVAGVNNVYKPWASVADYEITSIPSESQACTIKLSNVTIGSFDYVKDTGTIEEFGYQLNTWLRSMSGTATDASKMAARWEVYTWNDKTRLQTITYSSWMDAYPSYQSIGGCTLVELVGMELAAYTSSYNLNQIKQSATYNGMCRPRTYDFFRTYTDTNSNPTRALDGSTQLFLTFPCSQLYYDSSLGVHLREFYPSYDLYLDACMLRQRELHKASVQFRDGKLYTSLLKDRTIVKNNVEQNIYQAAKYCYDYDCGIDGYGPGTFWLPSMYELSILMRNIKADYSDPVNVALSKNSKWSLISSSADRWSSSRCVSSRAWSFHYDGISYYSSFYRSLTCSPVLTFTTA